MEKWKKILPNSDKSCVESVSGGKKRKKIDSCASIVEAPAFKRCNRLPEKFVIFAYHRDVMDVIESMLREKEVDYIRLDGSSSQSSRNAAINDFQYNDMADIALLSLKACGTGLNLTAASTALFAELDWSPATILQAEDRIHRIGQKAKIVKIMFAICEKSADDIIWAQLQKKHGIVDATVGASEKGNGLVIDYYNREVTTGQRTLDFSTANGLSQSSQYVSKKEESDSIQSVTVVSNTHAVTKKSSEGKNGIAQYLSQPTPVDSSNNKSRSSKVDSSYVSGAPMSRQSSIISAIDHAMSEIPYDLIEKQFALADQLVAAKRVVEAPPDKSSERITPAPEISGERQQKPSADSLLQAVHVDCSQFDYSSSQMSQNFTKGDGSIYSKQLTQDNSSRSDYTDEISDNGRIHAKKPKFGWSLDVSNSNFDPEKLDNKGYLNPYKNSFGSKESVPTVKVCPIPTTGIGPEYSGNKSQGADRRQIDEATKLRIEENRKRALERLKKLKSSANESLKTTESSVAIKAVASRPPAKVSPQDTRTNMTNWPIGPAFHLFSTGKGSIISVTENEIEKVKNIFESDVRSSSKNRENPLPREVEGRQLGYVPQTNAPPQVSQCFTATESRISRSID